jgi:hypothetical protein
MCERLKYDILLRKRKLFLALGHGMLFVNGTFYIWKWMGNDIPDWILPFSSGGVVVFLLCLITVCHLEARLEVCMCMHALMNAHLSWVTELKWSNSENWRDAHRKNVSSMGLPLAHSVPSMHSLLHFHSHSHCYCCRPFSLKSVSLVFDTLLQEVTEICWLPLQCVCPHVTTRKLLYKVQWNFIVGVFNIICWELV